MKTLEIKQFPQLPFDIAEAINQLRVSLRFCGGTIKTIMITSSTPNEGKSFVSMNLWRKMVETGSRALLIDCDLRNSEIRMRYGLSGSTQLCGIAHYLSEQLELDDVIYQTNISDGCIIPMVSTISNPSILLESARFSNMIQQCRDRFDYVIVDTPPLMDVADSMDVATHCDGSVLVVNSGVTPRKFVDQSVQKLKQTQTPLLGLVLNRIDTTSRKSNYYYKRYYKSGYYNKSK